MATLMDVQTVEAQPSRRPYFSAIRWGAISAGVVSGSASYLLLTLLGVAVGLTAVDPQAAEPVGAVPIGTGIWTGVSLLVGAFIGGYVAAHMSGLARLTDGMLHGFVSWGATTLLYLFLATTALSNALGGVFQIIGQGLQIAAPVAQQAAGQPNVQDTLSALITGGGQQPPSAEALKSVQQALSAGDREAAINTMVNEMGMQRDNATQVVDRVMPLFAEPEQAAAQAADTLAVTSWWLFFGLLLSLALGVAGGATGVRAAGNRLRGEHVAKRHI